MAASNPTVIDRVQQKPAWWRGQPPPAVAETDTQFRDRRGVLHVLIADFHNGDVRAVCRCHRLVGEWRTTYAGVRGDWDKHATEVKTRGQQR